ncbi:MAG: hypothetical protein K2W99_03860 [Chthoniobacterales bacterium]|nr:hypothetical protein [Chthoniobacterales bacterium]
MKNSIETNSLQNIIHAHSFFMLKRLFFSLIVLLLLLAVVLDRSAMGWAFEHPVVEFLAKKTERPLPQVTAVMLPLVEGTLVPQDVALTLRACCGFYPRMILVAELMGEITSGPLSLVREGIETGYVHGSPFYYGLLPQASNETKWFPLTLFFMPYEKGLPQLQGEAEYSSHVGFLAPENKSMPLFGKADGSSIVASLWALGLFSKTAPAMVSNSKNTMTSSSGMPPKMILLGGRLLWDLEHNAVLWLEAAAMLPAFEKTKPRVLALDDFLLKREEMERGEICPDLDVFFRNQTVLIGGPNVVAQAKRLQGAQEQFAVRRIGNISYGVLLLILGLGSMIIAALSPIDIALVTLFFFLCYALGEFLLFRSQGTLLPIFLPIVFLLVAVFKKIIPSCSIRKER